MVFTTRQICDNENLVCDTLRVNTECQLKSVVTDKMVFNELEGEGANSSIACSVVKGRNDASGGGRLVLSQVLNAKKGS